MFKEKDAEVVLAITDLPNGNKLYKIYTSREKWHEVTSDLRLYDLKTSSRSKYNGVHKIGKCLGSWICLNRSCTFWATSHEHQPNRINWKGARGWKDIKFCQICETVGLREGCGARKLVELNPTTQIAYVYHLGTHTCQGKIDKKKKKDQIRNRIHLKGIQGTGKRPCS